MKIGFLELVVIFIVALVVVGPDKLPFYAKRLGQALGEFKKVSGDLTKDIKDNIVEPLEEAQKPLKEAMEPLTSIQQEVDKNVKDVQKSFKDIGKPTGKETAVKTDDETKETVKQADGAEEVSKQEPAKHTEAPEQA